MTVLVVLVAGCASAEPTATPVPPTATAAPPTNTPLVTFASAPLTSAPEPTVAPVSLVDSGQRPGSARSWDVELGDSDGDGDLDAFVANGIRSDASSAVWLSDGDGTFTINEQDLVYGMGLELGDLDGDGGLDGDGDLDAFVVHGELGRDSGGGTPNEVWLNETP